MDKHHFQICDKCFHSRKALGGHMRSHLTVLPPAKDAQQKDETLTSSGGGGGDGGSSGVPANTAAMGYVLQENPKKSTKYSKQARKQDQQQQCKDCGKVFPSWRALFGHMRIHSPAAAAAAAAAAAVTEDSVEASASVPFISQRRPRSRPCATAAPVCYSSSILEQESEVEQLAWTLVLLSRDTDGRLVRSNAAEKIGIDDSIDGFLKNRDSCFASDTDDESKMGLSKQRNDSEIEYGGVGIKELQKLGKEILGLQRNATKKLDDEPKICTAINSKKRSSTVASNGSGKKKLLEGNDSEVEKFGPRIKKEKLDCSESDKLRKVYECSSCKKIFPSYQALGGHRAARSRHLKGCNAVDSCSSQVNMPQSQGQRQHQQLKVSTLPELFDLNLPVTADEDKLAAENDFLEMKLWWARSMLADHEPLLGTASS